MCRTKHRLISLLLCLLLLLPLFPAVVTAEEQATVTDGVTVVSEAESKRNGKCCYGFDFRAIFLIVPPPFGEGQKGNLREQLP